MEPEASHLHQRRRKHTTRAPLSSSSVQDSNFESSVLLGELIIEILLRLQVKHLLKFKSANEKTCHRLVMKFDSPENNLKDCSVNSLFYDHVTRTIDVDYLPKISYESTKFVGSVNVLICIAIEETNVFIWNPSIRKLKKLPSSGINCFYMYGFGYDELHDDYEVVVITRIVGMLVNGKLHWAITNKVSINYKDWVILVVDLVDGRWKEIENPCYGEGTFYSIMYLGVVGIELSMVCQSTMS
ncbi:hypothetical protein KY284_030163 [Solanum tuberosum]|nr:hypothetical protein KY284_030163 [Solanum tuberosum]